MHFFGESDIPHSPRVDTNYSSLLHFSQQTFGQDQDTPREGSLLLYPILGVNFFFFKLTPRTFNPFLPFTCSPNLTHPHSKLNDAQVSKEHLHKTKNLNLALLYLSETKYFYCLYSLVEVIEALIAW